MDPTDVTQVFGVRRPLSSKEELFHRELERQSLDIIRVANPDTQDFPVEWDKRYFRVPAQGTLDVPRYIAVKYCKDKAVDTINKINQKMHDKEMADRSSKGLPGFESKWHEAEATYAQPRYPKTNDLKLLTELYSIYWVGLVYEYGKDMPTQTMDQATSDLDMTPVELQIIKTLQNRRVDVTTPAPIKNSGIFTPAPQEAPVAPAQPVPTSREDLANEVTQNAGQ